jgi:hypothetical protein
MPLRKRQHRVAVRYNCKILLHPLTIGVHRPDDIVALPRLARRLNGWFPLLSGLVGAATFCLCSTKIELA